MNYSDGTFKIILLPGIIACALMASPALQAQDDSGELSLEEVMVTATKRAESVQDIPVSIETISGEAMTNFNITDIQDLSASVPNVVIGDGITAQTINMRGLGSGQERSFEQSVGMFIDGQYMPRSRQYRSPFLDVERVEVMRGPQAVIHGLNSTAGAISVITRKNRGGDEFAIEVTADAEMEYGGYGVTATLGTGIGDNFGVRVAVKSTDYDGWYENTFSGEDEGDNEETLARIVAVWNVTEKLDLTAKIEHTEFDMYGHFGEIYGGASGFLEPTDGILNWKRSSDGSTIDPLGVLAYDTPGTYSESDNYQFGLDYQIGENTLSLMAARSEFDYDLITDLDTWYSNILDAGIQEDYEQDSFEARLTSGGDGNFDWIAGIYYHDTDLFNSQPNIYGVDALGPGTALESTGKFRLQSELWSAFFQGSWQINEAFRLTAGARYSDEDKDVLRDSNCNLGILPSTLIPIKGTPTAAALCPSADLDGYTDSRSSSNFMPEVALQWETSDTTMFYAKISDSAKAGGFASATNARPDDLEYGDESALGFELGMKSRYADGRVELNIAAFNTEFDDLQVNSFETDNVGGVIVTRPVIKNAAKATSRGIEVDGRWAANNWLMLGASVAYLDAEYDKFTEAPCNPDNATESGVCDLSGHVLPFAPEFSGNIYADIVLGITSGINLVGGLNLSYTDSYYTEGTVSSVGIQDSFTRVDARIGIASANDRWSLSVIGKNLGDEAVNGSTQPFGSWNLGYLKPPRLIFLQGTVRFGG